MAIGTYTTTTNGGWTVTVTFDSTLQVTSYTVISPNGQTYYIQPGSNLLQALQSKGYAGTSLPAGLADSLITARDQAKALAASEANFGITSSSPTPVTPDSDPTLYTASVAAAYGATVGVADLATSPSSGQGIVLNATRQSAINQDQLNATAQSDWRVRLALSPANNVNYMYKADNPGILRPLRDTDGVIFPYTPTVAVTYAANYESAALVHNNYKVNQYGSSSVDSVSLTCDFTAQDVFEANYVLAVIHFFRSMTKMFYGQDQNPTRGTPPPLCYLYGLGDYQFSAHPLAITGFTYSLPNDVDYIATSGASAAASPQNSINPTGTARSALARLGGRLGIGGLGRPASFASTSVSAGSGTTWVPTKINMSISCLPMMSRNQVSNQFSLAAYANGSLLQGARNPNGGFW
jgi:hypothetical protein